MTVWPGISPEDPDERETLEGCAQSLYEILSRSNSPLIARYILRAIAQHPTEFLAVAELAPQPAPQAAAPTPSDEPAETRRRILSPKYGPR